MLHPGDVIRLTDVAEYVSENEENIHVPGRRSLSPLKLPCLVKVIRIPKRYFDQSMQHYSDDHLYGIIESIHPKYKIWVESKPNEEVLSKKRDINFNKNYPHSPPSPSMHDKYLVYGRNTQQHNINFNINNTQQLFDKNLIGIEDLQAWYELLSEDGQAAPGYQSIKSLVQEKRPDQFMCRTKVTAYKMTAADNMTPHKLLVKTFHPGTVFTIWYDTTASNATVINDELTLLIQSYKENVLPLGLATNYFRNSSHHFTHNKNDISKKPQYLRVTTMCTELDNFDGSIWHIPFGTKGYFSPVAKRENISGVHKLTDLLVKFQMPLKVRLLYYTNHSNTLNSVFGMPFPPNSVIRLLKMEKEYEFCIYFIGTDSIKRITLPYQCAKRVYILPKIDTQNLIESAHLNPTLKECLQVLVLQHKMRIKSLSDSQIGCDNTLSTKISGKPDSDKIKMNNTKRLRRNGTSPSHNSDTSKRSSQISPLPYDYLFNCSKPLGSSEDDISMIHLYTFLKAMEEKGDIAMFLCRILGELAQNEKSISSASNKSNLSLNEMMDITQVMLPNQQSITVKTSAKIACLYGKLRLWLNGKLHSMDCTSNHNRN